MTDLERIKRRLYNVLPIASLEMFEFIKLLDIKIDNEKVSSAAITCNINPTLLLNQNFIDTYCKEDEHLFMLIMHELYHVILGHTKMFKSHTILDNIAFDAIINSMLCKLFNEEKYTSFFNSINKSNSFPGAILRAKDKNTPKEYYKILEILYETNTGTYYDVYQEIKKYIKDNNIFSDYILIGNHDENKINNPLLKKMIEDMLSKWPRKFIITGRDLGNDIQSKEINDFITNNNLKKKMKNLLHKLKNKGLYQNMNNLNINNDYEEGNSFLIDYKDRTLLAKKILIPNNLIYRTNYKNNKITNDFLNEALIYLDVSGSVINDLKKIFPLLFEPYRKKECKLYVFSTKVKEITYKDLKNGLFDTTSGTNINCVFEHYFSLKKKAKKILILTDGHVGPLSIINIDKIKNKKIEVYVGLFSNCTKDDMKEYVKEFEVFDNEI